MNPAARPYWDPQRLPVLEAPPDGAESSGGGNGGNNNPAGGGMGMMSPVQQQGQIHPGQLRPISAATGYAVSSDFAGGGSGGGGDGCANGDASDMMMNSNDGSSGNHAATMGTTMGIMVQPDASGHHHYDRHHRQAQMVAAMQQPNNHPNPYSPQRSSSYVHGNHQQQHQHLNGGGGYPPHFGNSGYEYISGGGGVESSPGGNYGYNYNYGDHHNGHHNDDYDSPLAQSRGWGHGNHNNRKMDDAQMQKRLLRDPAVRSAYWRLKLSLATRAGPQDRGTNPNTKNKNNPFAARDMVNPTKAEAWLAAIGAAEAMAQKKSTDTSNSTGTGAAGRRRNNKKNRHQGHNDNEYRKRRGPNRKDRGSRHSNEGSEDSIDNKILAAGYLKHLLQQLNDDKPYWDEPPRFRPNCPNWDAEGLCQAALIVENVPGASFGMAGGVDGDYYDGDPYMDTTNNHRGGRFGSGNGGSNRYSVFGDDDDSDGDEDEQESTYGSGGENCEHGDAKSAPHSGGSDTSSTGDLSEEEIVYRGDQNAHQQRSNTRFKSKSKSDPNPAAHMGTRRIVVRVLAALGDVHSLIGISHSQAKPTPRWVRGASQYAFAFRSLTIGQELLDGQYAQMLQAEEEEEGTAAAAKGGDGSCNGKAATITTPRTKARLDKLKVGLATDSDIIAVSLTSFVRNRDRYLNAAKSRIEFLQGRLLEDRERREEAYTDMGQERWENNSSPRCDYSERRKKMERELRQAKEGCERVSKLDAEKKDESVRQLNTKKNGGDKSELPGGIAVEG